MSSLLGEIFKALLGGGQSGRQRSPTLTVEAELVTSNQAHSKPSKRPTDSYSELLKQATALKRKGDIDGSLI